jgi:hypothetical protein
MRGISMRSTRSTFGAVFSPLLAGSSLVAAVGLATPAVARAAATSPPRSQTSGGAGTTTLGSWTPLKNALSVPAGTSLVLTDGTIAVQHANGADWWRLTPDPFGSYVNGTWSALPPMPDGYAPFGYASAVLPDGRLIVEGGEYTSGARNETTMGAIYDPVANAWTAVAPPDGYSCIGDSSSVVLPDGRFLLATCWGTDDAILDPKTLTWTTPFSTNKEDNGHEEGWTLLQNGNVLVIDTLNFTDLAATETLDPRTARWSFAGDTPQQLSDLWIASPSGGHEMGPQVLRPDGTVWVVGGNGHSAVYHPPGSWTSGAWTSGAWTSGPDFPYIADEGQVSGADAPATVLPNGHAMVVTSPGEGPPPLHVYDFDGEKLTELAAPPRASVDPAFVTTLLILPSGEILFTDESADVEIFHSTAAPLRSSAPVIDPNLPLGTLRPGATYAVSGKQLNGVYQGSMYGDDVQQASNYPLVRITNLATGHVSYARTHDHSSMAVAPGNHSETYFDVPAGQEPGRSKLEVVANGIASDPIFVNVHVTPKG